MVVVGGREKASGVELGSVQHVWGIPTLLWAGQVFSGRSRSRCVGRGYGPRIRDEGVRRHEAGKGAMKTRKQSFGNVGERWRKKRKRSREEQKRERMKTSSR